MRQLFGTDGIRGIAGEYPLDRRTIYAIGRALGTRLERRHASPRVVIGQDTRESSPWIAETLARGLTANGAHFASAGVITTPGVAFLARTHGFAAGVVVSASHNPWQDNGIKLFGPDGMKLPDALEREIEKEIFAHLEETTAEVTAGERLMSEVLPGRPNLDVDYLKWLAASVPNDPLRKLQVLVDCANGAACALAPALFRQMGMPAEFLNVTPNGRNINQGSGALHPEHVAGEVKRRGGFDLGITFDGDADRALFSDAHGNVVNGDAVLLLAARDMQARGLLRNNTVVATTMSNMGLEKALEHSGIKMLRADVGDKYVLEQMQKSGATLGGEQSGHILFMDGDSTTGDGMLTALRLMDVVARADRPLHELAQDLKVFPQLIRNVRVREKVPLEKLPEVEKAIAAAERELAGNGRVVVRYSGTEKLARVMIEAESHELTSRHAEAIARAFHQAVGT